MTSTFYSCCKYELTVLGFLKCRRKSAHIKIPSNFQSKEFCLLAQDCVFFSGIYLTGCVRVCVCVCVCVCVRERERERDTHTETETEVDTR